MLRHVTMSQSKVKTIELLQVTLIIFSVSTCDVSTEYIYYKDLKRHCIPIYNCEPGNEIVPCTKNYTEDICTACPTNTTQPDLISSSLQGDYKSTLCFKPLSSCLAYDITYSRIKSENAFCESLSGCKCNTASCYFGDPCLCRKAILQCAENLTLTTAGQCVSCPSNTFRIGKGCGPCRHFKNQSPGIKITIPPLLKVVTSLSSMISSSISSYSSTTTTATTATTATTTKRSSSTSFSVLLNNTDEGEKKELYTTIVVVLAVLVIFMSLTIVIVCLKRSGMRFMIFTSVCWTDANITVDPDHKEITEQITLLTKNVNQENDNPPTNNTNADKIGQNSKQVDEAGKPKSKPRGGLNDVVESGYFEENEQNIEFQFLTRSMSEPVPDSKTCGLSDGINDRLERYTSGDNLVKLEISKQLYMSSCNSPVTQESEPHLVSQLQALHVEDLRNQISSYESTKFTNEESIPDTTTTSSYSPSIIVSDDQSERTETLQSDLCLAHFDLRGQQSISVDSFPSETKAKESGLDSIDSGVAV